MGHFWEPGHLAAVLFAVATGAGLAVAFRRRPGNWRYWACAALGIALIVNQTADSFRWVWEQNGSIRYDLPLNLCDVAAYVAGVALIVRRGWWVETAYFWGIGGSTMGLLFPDVVLRPLSYAYFEYYVDHVGVVLAAVLLVAGLGILPAAGAYRRICATTFGYAALVGLFDLLTGSNYFNLRTQGAAGSLTPLGVLSPWPWYLVEMAPVVLLLLRVLEMPFRHAAEAATPSSIAGAAAT
jgi:hypothetical integral membrane protein (TIGR02206 family)